MLKEYIDRHRTMQSFNSAEILDLVVSHIDSQHNETEAECLIRKIHETLHGKHFDEECAEKTVSKMYYIKDGTSAKTYGAFITLEQSNKIFSRYKDDISKAYNNYDFFVAMNMIYSDNYNLYRKWFKEPTEDVLVNVVTEATINWLNDVDSPYSEDTKIWSYLKH